MALDSSHNKGPRTAIDGSANVRQAINKAMSRVENSLEAVRREYITYGRTAMTTALGEDSKAVERIYKTLKDLLESDDFGKRIEDLP